MTSFVGMQQLDMSMGGFQPNGQNFQGNGPNQPNQNSGNITK